MLVIFCLLVVAAVTYSALREGLLTAACTLFNVLFAGLGAFYFFEPLAEALEDLFRGGFLAGTEDALALGGLFATFFAVLKLATGQWSGVVPEYHPIVDRVGSGVLGALAGYFLAGFLVCLFQTLPWSHDFLGYDYRIDPSSPGQSLRHVLPPDRVWLATMNRASEVPFARSGQPSFDEDGSFTLRYARYRRKAP